MTEERGLSETGVPSNPSINSHGEVVYLAHDQQDRTQIFSTVRGQLTSSLQGQPRNPEIDDTGRVVFEMGNLWEINSEGRLSQVTFFQDPEWAGQPTLAAETGELVYVLANNQTGRIALISSRDGPLYDAVPDPSGRFVVQPDLSPQGVLVFMRSQNSVSRAWLGIRASDGAGNPCTFSGIVCPPPPTLFTKTIAAFNKVTHWSIWDGSHAGIDWLFSNKIWLSLGIGLVVLFIMYKVIQRVKHRTIQHGKVFIGHGRSDVWKDLKDFIQDRLGLDWDEFNRSSPAGKSTSERLEEMLDSANFALLIMTAEDEHPNQTLHARENVIHEIGLFQGRLGFTKAIVLLEEGCAEFSNIHGLIQIRFPMGHIMAKSEKIRRVLEREGILS